MNNTKRLILSLILFVFIRTLVVFTYDKIHKHFYHEMVENQFLLAEAAWNGHWIEYDREKKNQIIQESEKENRNIPLEAFSEFPGSGTYQRFPRVDLPGYAAVIYGTSKLFGSQLTSRYAFGFQLLLEWAGLMLFALAIAKIFGRRIAQIFYFTYLFAFPFVHTISGQPMRDIFALPIYACLVWVLVSFFREKKKIERGQWLRWGIVIAFASLLLWIRPIGYYSYFLAVGLLCVARYKSLKERFLLIAVHLVLVVLFFSVPDRLYTNKYYPGSKGSFLLVGVWEGLANAQDPRYDFKWGDRDFLQWARVRIQDPQADFGDSRLNLEAEAYVKEILKKDPALYLKSILGRMKLLFSEPLSFDSVFTIAWFRSSQLSLIDYIRQHPVDTLHRLVKQYGRVFFLFSLLGMLFSFQYCRKEKCLFPWIALHLPLFYHLTQVVFQMFERRHFLAGAWVLCVPAAFLIDRIYSQVVQRYQAKLGQKT